MLAELPGHQTAPNSPTTVPKDGLEAAKTPQQPNATATKARDLEDKILALSGLELYKEIHVFDVPIDFEGENYIHTYRCGDENAETLVLLHGYGGCSLLYYPILKELSKKYRVYCIDLLGMGLSSRPEFKCTNTEETISYFVESLEKWREAVGLDTFYLAGHSFGGYMSTHYAMKYQQRVKKLLLISPAGFTKSQNDMTVEEWLNTLGWIKRKAFKSILDCFQKEGSLGGFYRKHPFWGKIMLKLYVGKRLMPKGTDKNTILMVRKFFATLFKLEGGSDKAIQYIIRPPRARPFIPLEGLILEKIDIPIVVYYGDKDWMDKAGAVRVKEEGKKEFKIKEIENSGHQVMMSNPQMLSSELISELIA